MNAKFLDGAAIVQMLNPEKVKTFKDYADMVFTPYISCQLGVNDYKTELFWFLAQQVTRITTEKSVAIYSCIEIMHWTILYF